MQSKKYKLSGRAEQNKLQIAWNMCGTEISSMKKYILEITLLCFGNMLCKRMCIVWISALYSPHILCKMPNGWYKNQGDV